MTSEQSRSNPAGLTSDTIKTWEKLSNYGDYYIIPKELEAFVEAFAYLIGVEFDSKYWGAIHHVNRRTYLLGAKRQIGSNHVTRLINLRVFMQWEKKCLPEHE